MSNEEHQGNYETFRDCFSGPIVQRLLTKPVNSVNKKGAKNRKNAARGANHVEQEVGNEAEDLTDFVDFLATELFDSSPRDLQTLSYSAIQKDGRLANVYNDPLPSQIIEDIMSSIPSSVTDSLQTYANLLDPSDVPKLLTPIFQDFVNIVTAPPPVWSSTRASACEICDRSWIPLTYHHLVPKQVHTKALKRGWHEEWRLNSVAWLCRACHSFVHRAASNEELAKDYWSVERLMEREDVQNWSKWVGRVRWKSR